MHLCQLLIFLGGEESTPNDAEHSKWLSVRYLFVTVYKMNPCLEMFASSAELGDVLEVHFYLGKLSTKAFVPTPLMVWTSVSQEEPNPRTKRRAMMHREGSRRRGEQADPTLGRQLDLSGSAPHSFSSCSWPPSPAHIWRQAAGPAAGGSAPAWNRIWVTTSAPGDRSGAALRARWPGPARL